MNFFKKSLGLFCLAVICLSSCKNDLKLNAPYKEYPSIYAVLNPFEKIQMIRVNKVFLGEGDANQMAKLADSINYQPNEITVSIKHSSNSQPIVFTESMVTTSDGAFNTNQRVYITSEKLAHNGTYTLTVKNNHTGNVFTSVASPLDSVNASYSGAPLSLPYFPYNPGTDPNSSAYVNYAPLTATGTKTNNVYIFPVPNAKIYKLVIRSHFRDTPSGPYNFVDYVVDNPKEISNALGTPMIRVRFSSSDYFINVSSSMLKNNIDKSVIGRKMWLIEYFVYASTQEFVDFNEYVKPSFGINQNKPLYSNFKDNGALGIFTFRSSIGVQKEMSTTFINGFSLNQYTKEYFK